MPLMTKRSFIIAGIGIALLIGILFNRSESADAIDTFPSRNLKRFDQPILAVRVSCQEIGARADISWTPMFGTATYTLSRRTDQDDAWTTLADTLYDFTFVDTSFPALPGIYEYQVTSSEQRKGGESSIVAVNVPSCEQENISSENSPLLELTAVPNNEILVTALDTQNLIRNPSFEIAGTNGNPQSWYRGGWGTNNGSYVYPVSGPSGGKAARVEMSSRINGDVKWFFEDTPVVAGKTYTISHVYRANTPTEITARFTTPTGIFYQFLKTVPATTNWTTTTLNISIPKDVTAITLFHILYATGFLEIDDYVMTSNATSILPPVSSPPTPPQPVNLIANPSLETTGIANNPQSWLRGGWGTNTRTYTYPVAGSSDSKGAKIEITSYTNGDAKWYFDDVSIVGGQTYTLSHDYKATTDTELVARYTTPSGIEYDFLSLVPPATNWSNSTINITAPTNALKMTLFHLLGSVGVLQIDNFSMTPSVSSSPNPTPTPAPAEEPTKYILLNAINWNGAGLQTLPMRDASEITYFVLPVSADGALISTAATLETTFVKNVHTGGKLATFSIGGGAQNVENITSAVTTNRSTLIDKIVEHITQYNYDGVTIDIENTNISGRAMVDFIKALRVKMDALRLDLIIGMYTQPYQIDTVWGAIAEAATSLTWLAPLTYDIGTFDTATFTSLIKAWEPKVGKDKLLAGIAVNYPSAQGGLSTEQFGKVLDVVTAQGWRGVGIWENTLYTQPWLDIRRALWPNIE